MRLDRRFVAKVLSVLYALLALNGWAQVVLVLLGHSSDPAALVAFQLGNGLAGAITAWGAWRGARWTPVAATAYGLVTAAMLISLGPMLNLPAEARGGLMAGATSVLLFGIVSAVFFRFAFSPRNV